MKNIVIYISYCSLPIILFWGCSGYFQKKSFASQYEFDDFSEFKGVSMTLRGEDTANNYVVFGSISTSVNVDPCPYYMVIDKKTMQVIRIRTGTCYGCLDTLEMHKLSRKFLKYDIQRLDVDLNNNIFVYFDNFEELSLVKPANNAELIKLSKEMSWKKVTGNWYRPKY